MPVPGSGGDVGIVVTGVRERRRPTYVSEKPAKYSCVFAAARNAAA
jgi:hypothetical protein